MNRKKNKDLNAAEKPAKVGSGKAGVAASCENRKKGGWQAIEALREQAELKALLADVWDDEFDLDEETLAGLDHKAEFFTEQEEPEEETFDEDDEVDEFFEDEEV